MQGSQAVPFQTCSPAPPVSVQVRVSERQKAPSKCSPAGQTEGAQRPAVQASGLTQSAEAVQA